MNLSNRVWWLALVIAPLLFAQGSVAGSITIHRDQYGMPSVYADTVYDLFYGYGYAVAEDRLFQTEMIMRATQGEVSEVLGETYLDFDKDARRRYNRAAIEAQIKNLSTWERQVLAGYAAGYSAYVRSLADNPDAMPYEFATLKLAPSLMTEFDLAMIFVGTMANRYSDFSTELDNKVLLAGLVKEFGDRDGPAIFDLLKWKHNPDSIPTINPQGVGQRAGQKRAGARPLPVSKTLSKTPSKTLLSSAPNGIAATSSPTLAQRLPQTLPPVSGASNVWLIGKKRSKGAKSIIVNGPQFGLYDPNYVYAIGLHGAGFNVVGNTPFAYPCILFGHNKKIAWGSTAGFGETVDFFSVKMNDAGTAYWYKNAWKKFKTRTEQIVVKTSEGTKTVSVRYKATVHGTVEKEDGATAYARARSWEGHELQSLFAWVKKTQAANWKQWLKTAAKNALNINWYYVDRKGSIGYAHTGMFPERRPGHDYRFPAPGDGSYDWLGIKPFRTNPQVFNPEAGYLTNWNNTPIDGYHDPDMLWWKWGSGDRVIEIHDAINSHATLTPDDAWDIIKTTSERDVGWRYFKPYFASALSATKQHPALAQNLVRWNGDSGADSRDVNSATANSFLFHTTLSALLKDFYTPFLKAPELGKFLALFSDTSSPFNGTKKGRASFKVSSGASTLLMVLQQKNKLPFDLMMGRDINQMIQTAYATAAEQLQTLQKENKLLAPATDYSQKNFMGIPQTLDAKQHTTARVMNRGTENNITFFRKNRAYSKSVAPPGQSGFRDKDNKPHPHHYDQVELYNNYQARPLPFTKRQVRSTAKKTYRIQTGE